MIEANTIEFNDTFAVFVEAITEVNDKFEWDRIENSNVDTVGVTARSNSKKVASDQSKAIEQI